MNAKIILLIIFFILFGKAQVHPCTIFYICKDNKIFGASNEDWENPYSKMWFFPAENEKHGWIKFGWGSFPQGGMNEQGLFWDASSCAYLPMPVSEANKEIYPGALMQKVIEESANIEEALEIFASYYCEDQYKAQYLLGDALKNSIIVEGDHIVYGDSNFQVLTNFYHSHPDMGGYPCWRYETVMNMLNDDYELSAYYIGSVLSATHQEGKYPTQYSCIYDLENKQVYLFHFHDYEEFIKIDLLKELEKGYRVYNIPELFSNIKLLTPEDKQGIESTSVTITWLGLPGSQYEVIISTDPGFEDAEKVHCKYRKTGFINISIIIYALPGLIFAFPWIRRKRIIIASSSILFFILLTSRCKKEETATQEIVSIELSETIDNLSPGTQYYWKIRASSNEQTDFYSESLSRSFITGTQH